jgi:sec-independent protein translocase protein TatB
MFDIGFLEMVVIGVLALLVLGPERLPKAARTAGKWIAKAKRMVSQFSSELDKQLEIDELRAQLKEQGGQLDINEDIQNLQNAAKTILKDVKSTKPNDFIKNAIQPVSTLKKAINE